jgi:sialate O-acetylesterase
MCTFIIELYICTQKKATGVRINMGVVRVASFFLLFLVIQCNGAPRFANYYQDHMVLQRAPQKAVVWGYGDASKLTTLRMGTKIYTTISSREPANDLGESIWSVTLDPVSDEGPFDIHISQPLANGTLVTITLHDVLFGDVWICSGQSNMLFTVDMMFNATEEIDNAGNFSKIRLLTVSLVPSAIPIEELLRANLNWSVASRHTVGGPSWIYMSAVCWLYGRMIHQALGGRPMGLIATSWGGTQIELWMPPEALHECNDTA